MKQFLLLLTFICFVITNSHATIVHVPSEYPTIQDGIDAATDGDTVLVAPGEYTGPGNYNIDFLGKAILVTSAIGPDSTFVGENPWDRFTLKRDVTHPSTGIDKGFIFESNETYSSVIKGFTITRKWHAVYIIESSPLIENCKIIFNWQYFGPEGHGIYMEDSSPLIIDCDIAYNYGGYVGAINSINSDPIMINTRIFNNGTTSPAGVGGMYIDGGNPIVINSVFYLNFNGIKGDGATLRNCIYWENFPINDTASITYTDLDFDWPGEGNIEEDPLFVNPDNFDFRLLPDSPCIDAGDPDDPNVPWGGFRRDMGAFEFDQGFFWNGQCIILKPFPIEMPVLR